MSNRFACTIYLVEPIILITSLAGIGYLPLSGVIGVILGMVWMYILAQKTQYWRWILLAQILLAVLLVSLVTSTDQKDPSFIVLDEFVAAGIPVLVLRKWPQLLSGMLILSILDSLKPIARFMESLSGGWGVVGDDVVSALLTVVVLSLIARLHTRFRINREY